VSGQDKLKLLSPIDGKEVEICKRKEYEKQIQFSPRIQSLSSTYQKGGRDSIISG